MEETLKFFSNFQQYTPYFLNKEYIITKEIRYRSDSSTTTDTQSMSVNDIFSRISENDGKFVCKHTGHLGQYRLTIGNFNIYINTILENRSIAHMLAEVLETASVAGSIENAFLCTWYYYDDDCTPRGNESDGYFYHFFVCKENTVVRENVSIYGCLHPLNMFVTYDNELFSNSNETNIAKAILDYDTWLKCTYSGKLHAIKIKLRSGASTNSNQNIITNYISQLSTESSSSMTMLTKINSQLNTIKIILVLILSTATYIALKQ